MLLKYRLIGVLLSVITACGFVPSVQAHEAAHADSLRMDAAPAPLAARYVVTVDRAPNPQPRSQIYSAHLVLLQRRRASGIAQR